MDMYKYEVGQKILPPGPDGVRFDMADSGGSLLIQMARPTAAEKRAFKSGISIRLSVVDQIISHGYVELDGCTVLPAF